MEQVSENKFEELEKKSKQTLYNFRLQMLDLGMKYWKYPLYGLTEGEMSQAEAEAEAIKHCQQAVSNFPLMGTDGELHFDENTPKLEVSAFGSAYYLATMGYIISGDMINARIHCKTGLGLNPSCINYSRYTTCFIEHFENSGDMYVRGLKAADFDYQKRPAANQAALFYVQAIKLSDDPADQKRMLDKIIKLADGLSLFGKSLGSKKDDLFDILVNLPPAEGNELLLESLNPKTPWGEVMFESKWGSVSDDESCRYDRGKLKEIIDVLKDREVDVSQYCDKKFKTTWGNKAASLASDLISNTAGQLLSFITIEVKKRQANVTENDLTELGEVEAGASPISK